MSNSANITWTMRLKKYTRLTAVSILMLVKILSLATRFPTSQKSPRPLLGHLTFLLFNRTSLHYLSQPGFINKDEPDLEHHQKPIQRSPRPQPARHRDLPDLAHSNRDLPDLNHKSRGLPDLKLNKAQQQQRSPRSQTGKSLSKVHPNIVDSQRAI